MLSALVGVGLLPGWSAWGDPPQATVGEGSWWPAGFTVYAGRSQVDSPGRSDDRGMEAPPSAGGDPHLTSRSCAAKGMR